MPDFIFHMQGVSKAYHDHVILQNVSLSFYHGAKIGVVGENGAGKTTLLRIMAGLDREHDGVATLGSGYSVLLVEQEPKLNPERDVRGNLDEAVQPLRDLLSRYEAVGTRLGEDIAQAEMDKLLAEMDRLQARIDATGAWELDRRLDMAASALLLPPDDSRVETLSGGERRRVALCKALLARPDLLLLDEPTNHLDAETIAWLEDELRGYPGTVIIVTHDRYFLDHITQWILELQGGRGIPYEGNYSGWLAQKAERLRVAEKQESSRQRLLRQELEWLGASQRGRQKKGRSREARYEEALNRRFEVRTDDVLIQIPPGPRLGEKVLRFQGVGKGYDGRRLIDDLSFDLPRGAVVGVVGPNGAGKTTLLRLVMGLERPDRGRIERGETVVLSYVDQDRDALVGTNSIWEEISGGRDVVTMAGGELNSRAYVSRFNFRGLEQQKKVGSLSGGERNRVHLAKLLKTGGNLLLLDEPTNDLDVNTLRVLEEALSEFPACALVISHDRAFLDRICTHLLVFEGGGRVRWFEGNFADYQEAVLSHENLEDRRRRHRRLVAG